MNKNATLGIVGATGAVGREAIAILAQRGWPATQLRLFASARSAGRRIAYGQTEIEVEQVDPGVFNGLDIAILAAGGSIARELAPLAIERGCTVVDNSSAFRMDARTPLVIPEINADTLTQTDQPRIIANPNCSTILALMAVTPLHRHARVTRMIVSTYQAASGAGAAAMSELEQQARDWAAGTPLTTDIFGRQYLFNVFSHNAPVGTDGENEEERKLRRETWKIWNDETIGIAGTCIRVPVLRAHCEAINLTFERPMTEDTARALLDAAPGVRVVDDREANRFPEPLDATGDDDVLVGRIRRDQSQPEGKGICLWVAGDQLRKGAALNAIQIVEHLLGERSRTIAHTPR